MAQYNVYYTCSGDYSIVTDQLAVGNIREITVEIDYQIMAKPDNKSGTSKTNVSLNVTTTNILLGV